MADLSNAEFLKEIQKVVNDNNAKAVANANNANLFTANQQAIAMNYNSAEAEKNRLFQLEMSNSSHQREVEDLQKAGLNPVLSANNGASTTSGSAGSISGASGQQATQDMQATSLLANYITNKMNNAQQADNLNKQLDNAIKLKEMENANALAMNQANIDASLKAKQMDIDSQQFMQAQGYDFDKQLQDSKYAYDLSLQKNQNAFNRKENYRGYKYDKWLQKQGYGYNSSLQEDSQKFTRQENYRGYKYDKWLQKQGNSNAYKIARLNAGASMYGSELMAAASRYGSELSSAASRYMADQNYNASIYNTDNSRANNPYGLADKWLGKIIKYLGNGSYNTHTGPYGNSSAK